MLVIREKQELDIQLIRCTQTLCVPFTTFTSPFPSVVFIRNHADTSTRFFWWLRCLISLFFSQEADGTIVIWLCCATGTHGVCKSCLEAISILWNAQLFPIITFVCAFGGNLLNKKPFDQNLIWRLVGENSVPLVDKIAWCVKCSGVAQANCRCFGGCLVPLSCAVPKDCHSPTRDCSPLPMKLLLLPREDVPKHYSPCLRSKRLLDLHKRGLPLGEKSEQENGCRVHWVVEDKGLCIFFSRISADSCWCGINDFLHFLIREESCHSSLSPDALWFLKYAGWVVNSSVLCSCPSFCRAERQNSLSLKTGKIIWERVNRRETACFLPFRIAIVPASFTNHLLTKKISKHAHSSQFRLKGNKLHVK